MLVNMTSQKHGFFSEADLFRGLFRLWLQIYMSGVPIAYYHIAFGERAGWGYEGRTLVVIWSGLTRIKT